MNSSLHHWILWKLKSKDLAGMIPTVDVVHFLRYRVCRTTSSGTWYCFTLSYGCYRFHSLVIMIILEGLVTSSAIVCRHVTHSYPPHP